MIHMSCMCLCLCPGLDFHEDLHRIGAKEGLKGRKLQKAMESYAWNITVLKVRWTEPHLACGPQRNKDPYIILGAYNQLDKQSQGLLFRLNMVS